MQVGDRVWHKTFEIGGIIRAANPVTLFVLWSNGVGTEVARTSVEQQSGEHPTDSD